MLCQCGCGRLAPLSRETNLRLGWRKGEPRKFIRGHYRPKKTTDNYKQVGSERLHRIRAARALGKPLPPGVIVHHADGSRDDHAPLVICPDDAYHLALHARMRIQAAGGNPWTDKICRSCQVALPLDSFPKSRRHWTGRGDFCRACDSQRRGVTKRTPTDALDTTHVVESPRLCQT